MIESHSKKISKTAHYYTLGEISGELEEFWIICHGYGQLASSILKKFEAVTSNTRFFLAPEGLSRFYWNGADRKVVASWMTRKDRLDEIQDYSNFLSELIEEYYLPLKEKNSTLKLYLFGFSQGCATVIRWIMNSFPDFDELIIWGGFFPEDLIYKPYQKYWSQKTLTFVCGDKDQYLTPERLTWHDNFLKEQHLDVEKVFFKGKHVIPGEELKKHFFT